MAKVLDSVEAARLLKVSAVTLRRWSREGRVPGRRVGRGWLFSEEALVASLTSPRLEPEPVNIGGR